MGNNDKVDEALKFYASSVISWSDCFNLTGTKDETDFYEKHIKDVLDLFPYVEQYIDTLDKSSTIVFGDIGSGDGIPLIPLSLLLDKYNIDFYAIERSHKRCVFLNHVISLLKNKGYIKNNITVQECDLKNVKAQFDIITFCALSQCQKIEKDLCKVLKPNGCIFAPKGNYNNANNELKSLKTLKGDVIKINSTLPRERCVLKLHI